MRVARVTFFTPSAVTSPETKYLTTPHIHSRFTI